jgi:hypothetical protein
MTIPRQYFTSLQRETAFTRKDVEAITSRTTLRVGVHCDEASSLERDEPLHLLIEGLLRLPGASFEHLEALGRILDLY